ncbi:MAG: hypothetical protein ABIR32_01005 [Ilumatobacteraceae bacterium]
MNGLRIWLHTWRSRFVAARHDRVALAAIIAVLAALAPIVVTVIRTALRRWVPIGDDGLLLLRTADVATRNHPWLGTWTSASLTAGKDFNNPGPLLFDILSVPVKLLGPGVGMPLGLGVLNGGAVVGAALVARRQAGPRAVIAMMLAAVGIIWAMGSELLIDPWQPHAMMLPFFLLIALLWGIVCGDLVLVPWFAAVASVLVQTHVSYSFLALFFTVGLGAAVVFHARRAPSKRAVLVRTGVITVVTTLVLWAQPFGEQLFGKGEGNLSRLLSSSSSDQPVIGLGLGTRLIANVVVIPPWFSRGAFGTAVPPTAFTGTGTDRHVIVTGVVSLPFAAMSILLFLAITALLLWRAIRHRQGPVVAALAMVMGLLACSAMAMVLMPIGIIGLSPHQMRWLWTISSCSLVTLLASAVVVVRTELIRRGANRSTSTVGAIRSYDRSAITLGIFSIIIFALVSFPTYAHDAGPTADRAARPTIVALMNQMTDLQGGGPYEFDDSGLRFAEPYSGAVMARLGELDIPFEVQHPGLVRQVGDGRELTNHVVGRLFLREGDEAVEIPAGIERVAFVPGLTTTEIVERDSLITQWVDRLTAGTVTLDDAGESALAAGKLGMSADQLAGFDDPRGVIDFGLLANASANGWLDISTDDAASLVRLSDLQSRWRLLTVGLFLAPIS